MKNCFNNFIIMGHSKQTIYKKPTFKEIYNSIINKSSNKIIDESVYQAEIFESLFNKIKSNQISLFTTEDLKHYFPVKSRVYKILNKNSDLDKYQLYVFNDDFLDKEKIKSFIVKVMNNPNTHEIDEIYAALQDSTALFCEPQDGEGNHGIIWVNKNIASLEIFQHEFIHYLEWVGNPYAISFNANEHYFEEIEKFKNMFNVTDEDIKYFLNSEEYQTLLTDFLNSLMLLKNSNFKDMKGYEYAKYISNEILKRENESVNAYLDRLKNFKYLRFLDNIKSSSNIIHGYHFAMVVAYNCMNYKITNIKNHIYGKFLKMK